MNKWLRTLLAATGIAAVLLGLLASPAAASESGGLAAVRKATAQFHEVENAIAAGYVLPPLPCFDSPGVGGMGLHYVNFSLLDGTVTPTKPQALVYEVEGDEWNLVAVEYLVPDNLPRPSLFGQTFHEALLPNGQPLGLWELHAYIWRHNPLGMFADYNPKVDLCPGH